MEMIATVIKTNPESMLVIDAATGNEVRVNFRDARKFHPGNTIRIIYNGIMTKSFPPQISADSIKLISPPQQPVDSDSPSPLSELRGVVTQRARNSLRLRDVNNRQIIVRYRYSYHFCVGQQVAVIYTNMMMGSPIKVNATDIIPIC